MRAALASTLSLLCRTARVSSSSHTHPHTHTHSAMPPHGMPEGLSTKEKRFFMANVFATTQNAMSQLVDDTCPLVRGVNCAAIIGFHVVR